MKQTKIMVIVLFLLVLIPSVIAPVWYGSSDGLVGHWSCEGNAQKILGALRNFCKISHGFLDSSSSGNNGTQSGGVKIGSGVKGRGCLMGEMTKTFK
ncbi:hypothetical protein KY314_02005 [Candidatus Woesearchaeota archaeon]|nr:hypothetical protein [Candidatus Woesearchaeota archaeon]